MHDLTAILVRFSDEEQIGNLSLEYQERHCRQFDARTAYRDGVPRQLQVEKDEAVSGAYVFDRPAVKRVLEFARSGRLERLLVYKWDRLGRNRAEVFAVIDELEMLGVEVLCATESNDDLARAVQVVLSDAERKKIGDRTRHGLRELASKGLWAGGPIPVGLKGFRVPDPSGNRDKKGNPVQRTRLVRTDDPILLKAATDVFELGGQGWSDKQIAWHFNTQGIPSPGRRGRGWDATTIRNIRTNPVYKGTLVHGRYKWIRVKGGARRRKRIENPRETWLVIEACPNIEPVVSAEQWERAQRPPTNRQNKGGRGPNPKYALSGIVLCGECEGRMYVSKSQAYNRLRCGMHERRGNAICGNSRLFAHDEVFDAILGILREDLFQRENLQSLIEAVAEEVRRSAASGVEGRAQAEQDMRKAQARLARVREALETSQEQILTFIDRIKELEAEIRGHQARLAKSAQPVPEIDENELREYVLRSVMQIKETLKNASAAEVQAELRRHLRDVRLSRDGRLRVEGTLEGLLQSQAVVRNLNSGGGI